MTDRDTERPGPWFRLTQETIAIITVGLALAGLNLATVADLREEARTDRGQAQAQAQADRDAWQAESRQLRAQSQAEQAQLRAEAQAERAQLRAETQADREAFQREILRLTAQQAKLAAIADVTDDHPTTD